MKWIFVILTALMLGGCADLPSGMCGNSIIQIVPSPNGQQKAVIFERDCGATTGSSTQVSILSAQASSGDEGGNVFTADNNHGLAPSGRGGGPNVWVKWVNLNKLKVVYDSRARTFIMEQRHKETSIIYQVN